MTIPIHREKLPLRSIYDTGRYENVMPFDRFDELINYVAREVKVPAGQLRLTDRFDDELKPKGDPRWDLGFTDMALSIDAGLKRHGRKGEKHIVSTVDEFLRLMNDLY